MDVTKPYEFIGFGAMDVTKPYEFIGFGAMDVTKPYTIIRFGVMDVPDWWLSGCDVPRRSLRFWPLQAWIQV
jgi:hypothetical protein